MSDTTRLIDQILGASREEGPVQRALRDRHGVDLRRSDARQTPIESNSRRKQASVGEAAKSSSASGSGDDCVTGLLRESLPKGAVRILRQTLQVSANAHYDKTFVLEESTDAKMTLWATRLNGGRRRLPGSHDRQDLVALVQTGLMSAIADQEVAQRWDIRLNPESEVLWKLIKHPECARSHALRIRNLLAPSQVFIGHGRKQDWVQVKEFLRDDLELTVSEFNLAPTTGIHTATRINRMLRDAGFAVIVMTAEDAQADTALRARQNVVHEVGLFQARLGWQRVVVLVEEGCEDFSNLGGLTAPRFPSNCIKATFNDMRMALKRELFV